MNAIPEIVSQIRALPNTFVDYGVGQGRDVILKQLKERFGRNKESHVDGFIEDVKTSIIRLVERAKPYKIPAEYIFFLEQYGGLSIEDEDRYYFATLGIGPWVEDWYSSINSDEAFYEVGQYGFLFLGSLNFRGNRYKYQSTMFFLDLAGIVQKDAVIGVGPMADAHFDVIKDVDKNLQVWRKVANSFTEWLKIAAETRGAFGYV